MEEWKPVPDFPGYDVSNMGRVRSNPRNILRNGKIIRLRRERFLQPSLTSNGYQQVVLSRDGHQKSFRVHDLVLRVWHGECSDGDQAIWMNGDSQDNRADNLMWRRAAMDKLLANLPPAKP
jgi:hypothetical protein